MKKNCFYENVALDADILDSIEYIKLSIMLIVNSLLVELKLTGDDGSREKVTQICMASSIWAL